MDFTNLDPLFVLNEQLAALAQAGVPLDVGLEQISASPKKALAIINARLTDRAAHGESLEEAIQGESPDIPTRYRDLVLLGIREGNLSAALKGSTSVATSAAQSQSNLRLALQYPLTLCAMAFLGVLAICWVQVPILENTYHALRIAPGLGLRVLQTLRSTIWLWAPLPPIIAGYYLFRWLFRLVFQWGQNTELKPLPAWIPGSARAWQHLQSANFSAALAALLERGVPEDEGLMLAGRSVGDAALAEASRALATDLKRNEPLREDCPTAKKFRPLLRWALFQQASPAERALNLRFAEAHYRRAAQQFAERIRIALPLVACASLGGGATLLYCLLTLSPVFDMLYALAK